MGVLLPARRYADKLAMMDAALPVLGDDRVTIGDLLLYGEAGERVGLEDLLHRALVVLAGRTLSGHQATVDEVGAEQLVYNIEVPFGQLLLEAADDGLVLFSPRRHSSFLLPANLRSSYGSTP